MRVKGHSVLALTALGLALSAAPASAATICVNPAGGACQTTISNAITLAAPLDTISIAPGTYLESVNVNKDGLKLIGVGIVIVDNEFGTGFSGPVIYVDGNNVALTNLTIRNGRSYGIRVNNARTGFAMTNVKVFGPADDCVHLNGGNTGAKIYLSTFRGCYEGVDYGDADSNSLSITTNTFQFVHEAIYGGGTAPIITGNKIGNTYSTGIYIWNADGAKVSTNTIYQTYYPGIYMYGDNATISTNTITNTYSTGIYFYGDGALIQSNILTNNYNDAIDAYGPSLQIKTNTIKSADGTGIYVSYGGTAGTADNAVITGNKISPYANGDAINFNYGNNALISANVITYGTDGIDFFGGDKPTITLNSMTTIMGRGVDMDCYDADPPTFATPLPCSGGLVQSNKLTDNNNGNEAFYIKTRPLAVDATGTFTVALNTATRVAGHCFRLNGNLITANANKGFDCGDSNDGRGFYVQGFNNTLTLNQVFRASWDGYYVETTDTATTTTLTGNLSDHAGEDGFDIHGSRITLGGNRSLYSNGTGFEVNNLDLNAAAITNVSFTGGNSSTLDARGACFSAGTTSEGPGTNSYGTPAIPSACDQVNGYIGN